ncbi:MAG TPA: UbiA family prenyltransferase [Actinomycetota bacterium]|nr:UbiA family prenyltransferase [Actinomycetota bacterium]
MGRWIVKVRDLIRATHPVPAVSVTLIVGALMVAQDTEAAALAWGVASTAAGQASVGWSNDYLDRRRDAAAGRREKPLVAGKVSARVVITAAVLAFVLCAAFALSLGGAETAVMIVAVASAWAYNAGLKDTVLSWVPYALSFGLLPVFVWLATPGGAAPPTWIVAGASLLGVAGHFMNVLPDLERDVRAGYRGLPHRLGSRGSLFLSCLVLAAMLVVVLIATRIVGDPSFGQIAAASSAAVLIVAVAWSGLRGRYTLGFMLTIAAAAAIALVVAFSPEALRR